MQKSNERAMILTSFALMDASPQRLDWHVWAGEDRGQGDEPGARLSCNSSV